MGHAAACWRPRLTTRPWAGKPQTRGRRRLTPRPRPTHVPLLPGRRRPPRSAAARRGIDGTRGGGSARRVGGARASGGGGGGGSALLFPRRRRGGTHHPDGGVYERESNSLHSGGGAGCGRGCRRRRLVLGGGYQLRRRRPRWQWRRRPRRRPQCRFCVAIMTAWWSCEWRRRPVAIPACGTVWRWGWSASCAPLLTPQPRTLQAPPPAPPAPIFGVRATCCRRGLLSLPRYRLPQRGVRGSRPQVKVRYTTRTAAAAAPRQPLRRLCLLLLPPPPPVLLLRPQRPLHVAHSPPGRGPPTLAAGKAPRGGGSGRRAEGYAPSPQRAPGVLFAAATAVAVAAAEAATAAVGVAVATAVTLSSAHPLPPPRRRPVP